VPEDYIRARLEGAGGEEIKSGKFFHPESSAALAVNAFGWFVPRPSLMPPLPGAAHVGRPRQVEIEFCARFPWTTGRHPWLDAAIFTKAYIVGVESKRFEPFRDKKEPRFSTAYERPVWGENMQRYGEVRRALATGTLTYQHLDGAQLVKHAYGLATEARRRGVRALLYYIYVDVLVRAGMVVTKEEYTRHRGEVLDFAARVAGDEVAFAFGTYREWLHGAGDAPVASHWQALEARFGL
jgi:hypothetical protein